MIRKILTISAAVSIIFFSAIPSIFSQDKYSPKEKEYMLNLARETLVWYLKYNQVPSPNPEGLSNNLKENRPCFVTLMKKDYGLRGCVGWFAFDKPLYKNIIDRSREVATIDNRFPMPVAYTELKDIKIEISILTTPTELKFTTPEDLLKKLIPFEDGVILYTEYGSSTYLPQVWEDLPNKEDFLSNLCRKGRAPADYWRTNYNKLRVEIYKAVHFAEGSFGGKKIVGPNGAIAGKAGAKVIGAVSLLKEGLDFGHILAKEGTELKPGAIVTEDSNITDK
jgi:AmmeMemoRadiSam system protein A